MKVRISYTTEVPDNFRRAIRRYYGGSGMATRDEIKDWYEMFGSSEDGNLMRDYDDPESAWPHEVERSYKHPFGEPFEG